jgi:DNA-binding GntR family transcriptional regulator
LREQPLADALGVSRNTVREALRLLSHDGLVIYHIHRGVAVKQLEEADVRDLYRTRALLELTAIDRSATASRDALVAIAGTVDQTEAFAATEDWRSVGTLDILFHQQIVSLLGSERIERFFRRVVAELRLGFAVFEPSSHKRFVTWNRVLADLLLAGERDECAKEMTAYLTAAEDMILSALRQQSTT